ncbi:MAG TPA: hypothetical protein VFO07_04840 [Roseiflexaceae bacterium]|nr:hypothetical protein [Roseiflexaceae bacterium]
METVARRIRRLGDWVGEALVGNDTPAAALKRSATNTKAAQAA